MNFDGLKNVNLKEPKDVEATVVVKNVTDGPGVRMKPSGSIFSRGKL